MAKHPDAIDADPVLSRKHTADLLRQLRDIRNELRVLTRRVTELETDDKAADVARRFTARRRAS